MYHLSQAITSTVRNKNVVLFLALHQKEKMSQLGLLRVMGLLLIRREIIPASIHLVRVHLTYP